MDSRALVIGRFVSKTKKKSHQHGTLLQMLLNVTKYIEGHTKLAGETNLFDFHLKAYFESIKSEHK